MVESFSAHKLQIIIDKFKSVFDDVAKFSSDLQNSGKETMLAHYARYLFIYLRRIYNIGLSRGERI